MRWVVVFERHLDQQDATRTHILEFCHALARTEDVVFVAQADEGKAGQGLNFSYKEVTPFVIWPSTLARIVNTSRLLFDLLRMHRAQPVDAVYVRATSFGLGPLLFGGLTRVPSFVEINGAWSEEAKFKLRRWPAWKRFVYRPVLALGSFSMDLACRLADTVVAVTPGLCAYLESRGIRKEKIAVVSNGANVEHFVPLDKDSCKDALGLSRDLRYVGFVGNLAPWQGVQLLLRALVGAIDSYPDCKLLIVGDGVERETLTTLTRNLDIDNNVIFAGSRPYREVPTYMGACDVLVAPKVPLASGYSPLKLYEYMACARPILASRVEGLELVEERGIGAVFEPGDVSDLACQLVTLLDMSEDQRQKMGQLARQIVVEEFSWDATVSRVRSLVTGWALRAAPG